MSHCKVVLLGLQSHSTIVDIHHPISEDRLQITLSKTNLGDKGLKAFIESLQLEGQGQFSRLELQENSITVKGLSYLAESLCLGKIIVQGDTFPENYDDEDGFPDPNIFLAKEMENVELHLDYNPLGLEGTKKLVEMLISDYCQVKLLSLEGCKLTTDLSSSSPKSTGDNTPDYDDARKCKELGEFLLCQMPGHTRHTITHVYLDCNRFTKENILILAGFISLCPMLTVLSTCFCAITSDDLCQLLDQLAHLNAPISALIAWHLRNNKIDDVGVSSLIEHLQNTSLFPCSVWSLCFSLQCNKISADMITKLEKELEKRHKIGMRIYKSHYEQLTVPEGDVSLPSIPDPLPAHAPMSLTAPELQPVASPDPLTAVNQPQAWWNEEIDIKHNGVSKHLGQIADYMHEWEGPVAEELGLKRADISAIRTKYPSQLKLQTREALEIWKQKHGSSATYKNLFHVFQRAGYQNYADKVRKITAQSTSEGVDCAQAMSLECATTSCTLSTADNTS